MENEFLLYCLVYLLTRYWAYLNSSSIFSCCVFLSLAVQKGKEGHHWCLLIFILEVRHDGDRRTETRAFLLRDVSGFDGSGLPEESWVGTMFIPRLFCLLVI
jgi:hypothetical protein